MLQLPRNIIVNKFDDTMILLTIVVVAVVVLTWVMLWIGYVFKLNNMMILTKVVVVVVAVAAVVAIVATAATRKKYGYRCSK